jgi:hypothetical protein
MEYRRLGYLPTTTEMQQSKKEFIAELDEVAMFASECVASQTSPQGYVSRKDMYDKFKMWWTESNEQYSQIPSMNKFTRRMKALGYKASSKTHRINGGVDRVWIGVKLAKKQSNVISMPTFVTDQSVTDGESVTPKNTD